MFIAKLVLVIVNLNLFVSINTKQKHLGCKKGKVNQKQQLSDYSYIATHVTQNFDIS